MKKFYRRLVQFIGYTIEFQDTINMTSWETTKRTHIALYKYCGVFEDDNNLKLKRVWQIKIK